MKTNQLENFTDDELQNELARRQFVRDEREAMVYRGEIECTDTEGVITQWDLR